MILDIGGAKVYCQQLGKGTPVLLLHGWGGKCESFAPVLRDFADKFCMTALDFPGQGGRSSDPPVPWGVAEYMETTVEMLRRMGIHKTNIVAHSFGGRVALMLAAEHPDMVGRMVLTGVPGLKAKPTKQQQLRASFYKLLKSWADNSLTRKVLGTDRVDHLRSRLQERFGSADYRALSPEMRKTFSRVVSQDLSPYLERVKAPTLLFWGSEDTAAPLWMGQEMEKRIGDAGLVVMQGAGHFAYLDRYGDFKAILQQFFA